MELISKIQLFKERLIEIYTSEECEKIYASMSMPKQKCFRLNQFKESNIDRVIHELSQLNITNELFDHKLNIFSITDNDSYKRFIQSDLFLSQRLYIQNPSSILAAHCLDINESDRVLDMAASPGSKTLILAEKSKHCNQITALEIDKRRFIHLNKNLELHGAMGVNTLRTDAAMHWESSEKFYSRILCDAPCSSESYLDFLDKKSFQFWNLKKVKSCASMQSKILKSAIRCLKNGAELIYSTCSFAKEENEMQIEKVLLEFEDQIKLESIPLLANIKQAKPITIRNSEVYRIIPDHRYHAFFIAKIVKSH